MCIGKQTRAPCSHVPPGTHVSIRTNTAVYRIIVPTSRYCTGHACSMCAVFIVGASASSKTCSKCLLSHVPCMAARLILFIHAYVQAIRAMTEPKLTTTWGAGFAFSKCHAERRVPYDPYLDQVSHFAVAHIVRDCPLQPARRRVVPYA